MRTECTGEQLVFQGPGRREIRADFDGGDITSDGGALLLRAVEQRTGILEQFAHCFDDYRDPARIEHSVRELVAQRVLGIALGYEDLNDHDDLRFDPLLATVVGKTDPKGIERSRARDRGSALAAKSTLNRIELSRPDTAAEHRYNRIVLREEHIDQVFLDVFLTGVRRAASGDRARLRCHGRSSARQAGRPLLPRLLRALLLSSHATDGGWLERRK